LMLFSIQTAGWGYMRQHDHFAELTAGTGVLYEARSPWERVSSTAARTLKSRARADRRSCGAPGGQPDRVAGQGKPLRGALRPALNSTIRPGRI
jgi:hypothetical protein